MLLLRAGASQPHKHVQVVPLPLDDSSASSSSGGGDCSSSSATSGSLAEQQQRPPIWAAVAAATSGAVVGQPVELRDLPFAAFAARLAPDPPVPASPPSHPPTGTGAEGAADSSSSSLGARLAAVYQLLLQCCQAHVEAKAEEGAAVAGGLRQAGGVSTQDGSLSYNMGE